MSGTNRDILDILQSKLVGVLVKHIEPIFKSGTKFAVIARTPGNNEADVLVTDDSIEELKALLDRSLVRPPFTERVKP